MQSTTQTPAEEARDFAKKHILTRDFAIYSIGVVVGIASLTVVQTFRKDLLILPFKKQLALTDGTLAAVSYVTKRGTFFVLPERLVDTTKPV